MHYDPQGALKNDLKVLVEEQCKDLPALFQYPKVSFWFYMPIPKSMAKSERIQTTLENLRHVKKPDVDNLIKLYLDVMTKYVYDDDNCVSLGSVEKFYSDNPRTEILIEESTRFGNMYQKTG
jgi:Holliday junction resolvase RusA-like endonuclease